MECSAMSAAGTFKGDRACRGGASAPGQGIVTENTFAPAGIEPAIPRIPHIPRNGRPDRAGSGNGGKEGNGSAGSGGSDNVFSPGCWSAGVATERSAVSTAGISGVTRPLGGAMAAPRQGALTEKKFAPARTDQNIPHFPHIPRNGRPDQAQSGNVGKEGNGSAGSGGSDGVFPPDTGPQALRW